MAEHPEFFMTCAQGLAHMRARAPLVQNITNYVAMNVMANVALAAGASPAMVHAHEEAPEFARIAQALTINIGTLSGPWIDAMYATARAANDAGTPWVLDPVAVGATDLRRKTGRALLALGPRVVRANASEILALAGGAGAGRGVDSTDGVAAAESAAIALAQDTGAVIAVTGARDFITDGTRHAHVENGDAMMPRVTALGCALTGVVAAFIVDQDPFEGTVAALAYYGAAGERAARSATGPGSFQTAFLDALFVIQPDDMLATARGGWA